MSGPGWQAAPKDLQGSLVHLASGRGILWIGITIGIGNGINFWLVVFELLRGIREFLNLAMMR